MTFKIDYINGETVVACDTNDEDFRLGVAEHAVRSVNAQLYTLRRSYDGFGFEQAFMATMSHSRTLLEAAIEAMGREKDSEVIANNVFGEEWLVGKFDSKGGIVIATDEHAPVSEHGSRADGDLCFAHMLDAVIKASPTSDADDVEEIAHTHERIVREHLLANLNNFGPEHSAGFCSALAAILEAKAMRQTSPTPSKGVAPRIAHPRVKESKGSIGEQPPAELDQP